MADHERLDRLIAAEQDERRRIALFLHDGPVQQLSGIALMLDAAQHSIASVSIYKSRGFMYAEAWFEDTFRDHSSKLKRAALFSGLKPVSSYVRVSAGSGVR